MKKFYEAPVVELTGFSAEDVITTSTIKATAENYAENAKAFETAVKDIAAANYEVANYSTYQW